MLGITVEVKLHLLDEQFLDEDRWPEALRFRSSQLKGRLEAFVKDQLPDLVFAEHERSTLQLECKPHMGTVVDGICTKCKAVVKL